VASGGHQKRNGRNTTDELGRASMAMNTAVLKAVSYNCAGFKSAHHFISCAEYDVMFACETWLQPRELPAIQRHLHSLGFWSTLKSSMSYEDADSNMGRPYGGIGFLCRKQPGLTFKHIDLDNERLDCIEILMNGKASLTIFGVYLPYYNGSAEQVGLYNETLDHLHSIINECSTPFLVMGDMNASLPSKSVLSRGWFRRHPFNSHSLLLYDFVVDNGLSVLLQEYKQSKTYSFFRGDKKSLIDHVLCSENLRRSVLDCQIEEPEDNPSDHLPVYVKIQMRSPSSGIDNDEGTQPIPTWPRLNWSNHEMRERYAIEVRKHLSQIPTDSLSDDLSQESAEATANALSAALSSAMHDAVKAINEQCDATYSHGKKKKNHWWNQDCHFARDRHRFWFHLWKDNGRPREGALYDCHKYAKKAYRRACRDAVHRASSRILKQLDSLFTSRNYKCFWNKLAQAKTASGTAGDEVSSKEMSQYFESKFGRAQTTSASLETVAEAESFVEDQCMIPLDGIPKIRINSYQMSRLVRRLKLGCSPGVDGIAAEHLR